MIDLIEFNNDINQKNHNCYIFVGHDEHIIKENIKKIVSKYIKDDFKDLNYVQFDGADVENFNEVYNACETLPFMSEKKIVLFYRASFLDDKKSDNISKNIYKEFYEYIKNIPPYCVLILYYVMNNKRDKISNKLKSLDNKVCVVSVNKIKGINLEKKIEKLFEDREKTIGKVALKAFVHNVEEENFNIIENEVEKICCYTMGEDIQKKHIDIMYESISDQDIFDLMNLISQKKTKEAIEIYNELLFKGEKINYILTMIEKQFRNLYLVKLGVKEKKSKEELAKELGIHPYGCGILMMQSKRFTEAQLIKGIKLIIETDKKIKSTSINQSTEIELLIINIISA